MHTDTNVHLTSPKIQIQTDIDHVPHLTSNPLFTVAVSGVYLSCGSTARMVLNALDHSDHSP